MTFTHDDIQSRLIEFLYGELDGDARVAFQAHLAACERCRADVTAFQSTRDLARAAVRSGLEDAVPAGVRARILEAAAAVKVSTVTEAGSTAARAAAAGGKKPSPLKSKGEDRGPFAWLRARWAVPMFVTVAAMGALLLVRETIYREARKPLGESPAPEVTVPPPAAPASGEAAPTGSAAQGDEAANAQADQAPREAAAERFKSERRSVAPPAVGIGAGARQREAPARVASKGNASKAKSASAPATEGAAPAKKTLDKSLDSLLSGVEKARPAKRDVNDDVLGGLSADRADGRGFAQPPPPRAGAVPRAPAPVAAPAPKPSSVVMDMDDSEERPQRTQQRQEKRAASRAEESEPAVAAAAEAPASAHADLEERAPSDAAAPLAARAEKLMASQQWAQAAAAYRQLIARFPKHEQVPNWRRRLAVVEAAAARAAPPSK